MEHLAEDMALVTVYGTGYPTAGVDVPLAKCGITQ